VVLYQVPIDRYLGTEKHVESEQQEMLKRAAAAERDRK
jgi:hypothetical protein